MPYNMLLNLYLFGAWIRCKYKVTLTKNASHDQGFKDYPDH
jgi:hypothetical protein